jgi:hypothetical protein
MFRTLSSRIVPWLAERRSGSIPSTWSSTPQFRVMLYPTPPPRSQSTALEGSISTSPANWRSSVKWKPVSREK